jgi:NADH-quinone oxidoreductase subunit H
MKTNRPPFDLSEAQLGMVAGYIVEYSEFVFELFYLGEYLNLFTNPIILSIVFLGSWCADVHYFQYCVITTYYYF